MIILYILIIIIGAIPLWKTIRFIQLEEKIRKEGITTHGVVTHIHTIRYQRGPATDRVHTRYSSIVAGQYHEANFVTRHNQFRIGQSISVKYLPCKTDKIIVSPKRGYWLMLIFSILLLLFVFFATYKIDEMVSTGGAA